MRRKNGCMVDACTLKAVNVVTFVNCGLWSVGFIEHDESIIVLFIREGGVLCYRATGLSINLLGCCERDYYFVVVAFGTGVMVPGGNSAIFILVDGLA